MVVTEYYPTISGRALSSIARPLRLNFFGDNRFTVVDGRSGSKQRVVMHDSLLLNKQVSSPDGRKVAFGTMDGNLSIWQIPPRRSLVPLTLAVIITAVVFGGTELLMRRGPTQATSRS
jgi:hypothetical protein